MLSLSLSPCLSYPPKKKDTTYNNSINKTIFDFTSKTLFLTNSISFHWSNQFQSHLPLCLIISLLSFRFRFCFVSLISDYVLIDFCFLFLFDFFACLPRLLIKITKIMRKKNSNKVKEKLTNLPPNATILLDVLSHIAL